VKEKLLTAVIYLLTTGLGVFAYIYPLLETPNQAILSSNRQNELPIMMAMILALCSIVLIYEIQQYRLNTKLIAFDPAFHRFDSAGIGWFQPGLLLDPDHWLCLWWTNGIPDGQSDHVGLGYDHRWGRSLAAESDVDRWLGWFICRTCQTAGIVDPSGKQTWSIVYSDNFWLSLGISLWGDHKFMVLAFSLRTQ